MVGEVMVYPKQATVNSGTRTEETTDGSGRTNKRIITSSRTVVRRPKV